MANDGKSVVERVVRWVLEACMLRVGGKMCTLVQEGRLAVGVDWEKLVYGQKAQVQKIILD